MIASVKQATGVGGVWAGAGLGALYRDRFYKALFDEVYDLIQKGGPLGGGNFWAWGGASRPGDGWLGDPPHETPGWYSVYNTDESTIRIISSHATDLKRVMNP